MRKGAILSGLFHLAILLLIIFGLLYLSSDFNRYLHHAVDFVVGFLDSLVSFGGAW